MQITGATRVGTDTCVQCHRDVTSNFRHAFHALQGVECEDCHGPGSLHVEGSGDVAKIISFRSRPAEGANGVCLSCHVQDAAVRNWMAGTHAAEHVRCTECHQIHTQAAQAAAPARLAFDTTTPGSVTFAERLQPESTVRLAPRGQINESCLKCHQSQRAEMSLPYHHPLQEGKVTCVDCHNPHGGPAGKNLRVANVNQLCLSCHAQYRGPYMYQHPPVNENCLDLPLTAWLSECGHAVSKPARVVFAVPCRAPRRGQPAACRPLHELPRLDPRHRRVHAQRGQQIRR